MLLGTERQDRTAGTLFGFVSHLLHAVVQTHVRLTRWEMRDRKKKERGGRNKGREKEGKNGGWKLKIKMEEERLEGGRR